MDLEQVFEAIDLCTHRVQVAEVVNKGERTVSVNFTNLYCGRIGTIEFRFPQPGCKPRHVLSWAELCGMFVAAAVVVHDVTAYPQTGDGLRRLVSLASAEASSNSE